MDTSAAESLAGFAVLVTIGSLVLGFLLIGTFFITAFNVGTIMKQTKAINLHQHRMQSSLDSLVKLLREQAKEKIE